jgi:hypothetical protein
MRALERRQATAADVVRVEDAVRRIDEPPLLVVGEARFLTLGGVREEEEVAAPDPDPSRIRTAPPAALAVPREQAPSSR